MVLKEVVHNAEIQLRTEDSIGRMGGEEFNPILDTISERSQIPIERYRIAIESLQQI